MVVTESNSVEPGSARKQRSPQERSENEAAFNPRQPFADFDLLAATLDSILLRLEVARFLLSGSVPNAALSLGLGSATLARHRKFDAFQNLLNQVAEPHLWRAPMAEPNAKFSAETPLGGLDLTTCRVNEVQARMVAAQLIRHRGNVSEAATSLDIGPATIYRYCKDQRYRELVPAHYLPHNKRRDFNTAQNS